MTQHELIQQHFTDNIQTTIAAADTLAEPISQAGQAIAERLLHEAKIMACGNGGSAADSQHFIANLINRFETERPSLPGIALASDPSSITAVANDYAYKDIFAKQVRALGHKDDILLAISTSGSSENIVQAVAAAHTRDMLVIALTGASGGRLAERLNHNDILISVPSERTCRIQEVHMLILHALCDQIDQTLFGQASHL